MHVLRLTAAITLMASPLLAQRTRQDITAADLRARLSIFADDSMQGRGTGTAGHDRGNRYLVAELTRMGLQPGGDNGTFLQAVPLVRRMFDSSSTITIEGRALVAGRDYQARDAGPGGRPMRGAQAIFAGQWPDTANMISPSLTAGKIVVVLPPGRTPQLSTVARAPMLARYANAAAIVVANLEIIPPGTLGFYRGTSMSLNTSDGTTPPAEAPSYLHIPRAALQEWFGMTSDTLRPGMTGRTIDGVIRYRDVPVPSNNVVAIVPGRDAALRGQYVAMGAHSDAIGLVNAREHDSTRAFRDQINRLEMGGLSGPALFQAVQQIRVNVDSLRAIRPPRRDSIVNGADDDGSGSMGLLELAEYFVRRPTRRSLVLVWHVGEEQGLFGSDHFTRRPTVTRDSIVAQLNIDMIGRGAVDDVTGGGAAYLQAIGSRRLSTELGTIVDSVNARRRAPFTIDYQYDAAGHPENFYCRSDHYMYARYGIPIAFFSTGGHRDYHQVGDEAAYIDFDKLMNVTQFVADLGRILGDRASRPVVDGQRAVSIDAPCQQ